MSNPMMADDEEFDQLLSGLGDDVLSLNIQDKVLETTLQLQSTTYNITQKDKVFYCLGVINLVFTTFVFAHSPNYYPLLYTAKALILLPIRFFMYQKDNLTLFMGDYCYFSNVTCLFYIWFFPHNSTLFQMCFVSAMGPLLWAIPTWRNAFVFHSLDKITSVFIHLSPVLAMVSLRFYNTSGDFSVCGPEGCDSAGLYNLFVLPYCWYLVWQSMYYVVVYVIYFDRITAKKMIYSYSYSVKALDKFRNEKGFDRKKMPASYKFLTMFGEKYMKEMFVVMQALFTVFTMLGAYLWFHSLLLTYGIVIAISNVCLWNGAGFYFDYFTKRYTDTLTKRLQRNKEILKKLALK